MPITLNSDLSDSGVSSVSNPIYTFNYYNSITKSGVVVSAIFGGNNETGVSIVHDSTVIGVIPSGYRPKRKIPISAWANFTSSS